MASGKLDLIDHKLLEILQSNGKITNAQLSKEIGLSPAPTLERVKKLENTGIIESYHAQIDREKVGLGVMTFVCHVAQELQAQVGEQLLPMNGSDALDRRDLDDHVRLDEHVGADGILAHHAVRGAADQPLTVHAQPTPTQLARATGGDLGARMQTYEEQCLAFSDIS